MLFALPVIYGAVLLQGSTAAMIYPDAELVARDCPHDNCLRVVIASAYMTRSATADCSSYFLTTVTPATYTTTTTLNVATSYLAKRDEGAIYSRQETVIPSNIPAYASACSGSIRYSSACSCIGVTAMTTTAATPTYTQTVTATTVIVSPPTLLTTQYLNLDCDPDIEATPTTLTLNTCVETTVSYTFNFNAFIPGACTPAECFVDFYDTEDCGDTPVNPGNPVTSTDCFNVGLIGAVMLTCPTCPQS